MASISSGGVLDAVEGATLEDITVSSGAALTISPGVAATDITVGAGGNMTVTSDAGVSGTTVEGTESRAERRHRYQWRDLRQAVFSMPSRGRRLRTSRSAVAHR